MRYVVNVNRKTNNYTLKRVVRNINVKRVTRNITINRVGKPGKQGNPGEGVPTGGLSGQVLSKVSEDNYDTAWVDQTGGGGDVISVNGRTGEVTGLAEKAELDMVENELYQDLTQGDAATLELAKDDAQERVDILDESLSVVAKTGSYNDLLNKPVIPTAPVTSVNGRTGAVTGLAEQALLDMVEEELFQDITEGDSATLSSANSYTDMSREEIIEDRKEVDNIIINSSKDPIVEPISIFSDGNGFIKNSFGGTQTQDSSDGYKKTSSMVLTTTGGGVIGLASSLKNIPVLDLSGKLPVIAVKIDNVANLGVLSFAFSSDNFATNRITLTPTDAPSQLKSNVWVALSLSFGKGVITGSPNLSAINAVQVLTQDNGSPVSVKFGLIGYTQQPYRGVVTLTFDDGLLSQYTKARSKMDEYGMPGTIYVNPGTVGTTGKLTVAQLKEMQDNSQWDVSSHSYNHVRLSTDSSAAVVETELRTSKEWLITNGFTKGAEHLAYPYGDYDYTKVIPIAKKYYSTARTVAKYPESTMVISPYTLRTIYVSSQNTLTNIKNDITRAINNNEWGLVTFHDIVTTPVLAEDWPETDFNALIDWLATQNIEVRTISDVYGRSSGASASAVSSEYVKKSGDTMTGALTNSSYISASGDYPAQPTQAGVYLGAPSGGNPRFTIANGTPAQTVAIDNLGGQLRFVNSGGSSVFGRFTGASFASGANLGYELGTSSLYWSTVYARRYHLNSTAHLDGSTAGVIQATGYIRVQNGVVPTDVVNKGQMDAAIAAIPLPVQPTFSAAATTLTPGSNATATVTGTQTDPVINIGVPAGAQGASGMPNTDLVGSGAPNGVVSGSIGTIYKDTRAYPANIGAFLWVKTTATGNTGWEVVYGDTRWRRIDQEWFLQQTVNPDQPMIFAGVNSGFWVRRVNNTVQTRMIRVAIDRTALPTVLPKIVMPPGFAPDGQVIHPFSRWDATGYFGLFWNPPGQTTRGFFFASSGPQNPWQPATNTLVSGNWSWVTNEVWPTILPGTT